MASIRILRLPHGADLPLPAYESAGAAGMDLRAALGDDQVLELAAGARALVPTGLCLQLPDGFEAQVRPRSGLAAKHGVTVLNAPGTVDSDYRGEVKVILINHGEAPYAIRRGDRNRAARDRAGDAGDPGRGPCTRPDGARPGRVRLHRRFRGTRRRPGLRLQGSGCVILLSRRSQLAIAAVVDIALHARPSPVAAKLLAARHDLPPRHLETLLQALVRVGILKGVRGPRGGYELARERRRITAGDIARAAMQEAGDDGLGPMPHSRLIDEVIGPEVMRASQAFLTVLDDVTVEELCRRAQDESVFGTASADVDFTI